MSGLAVTWFIKVLLEGSGANYKGHLMTLGSDSDVAIMSEHAIEYGEDVVHGINAKVYNDSNNQKQNQKDELHSNSDSESDGEKIRFLKFNMDRDIDGLTFKVGMVFSTRDEFKVRCSAYGIKHKFDFFFFKLTSSGYKLDVEGVWLWDLGK
ncbi:hypothetical protein GH714_024647 [Hevea brasiliensis]|uniref:Uncharacterized protein n=1 Tax=Hevea brasiliensis TaxID=3981 RepID=A0A6A6LGE3_HEVBR|nr:hypothetical protein GH714_024647 [Hevea brasiliensis]